MLSIQRAVSRAAARRTGVPNYMWAGGDGWGATQIRKASVPSFADCAPAGVMGGAFKKSLKKR